MAPSVTYNSVVAVEDNTEWYYPLLNDEFGGEDPDMATYRIVVAPTLGTAKVFTSGSLRYHGEIEGLTTLVYEICNSAGACDQATVTIKIVED